ncbi:MAG: peptidoglycan-binding protein [Rhodospirillaceae bacterium]|nr:peptidoglycan-binding protein [Rhodospirillaceae bacterium]
MFGSDFHSLFSEKPKKTWQSGLGPSGGSWRVRSGSFADDAADDDRFGAFQQAWKSGASNAELFGDDPFQLGGPVGAGSSANRRPDVAKVETFLGRTGHYKPLKDGPSGYVSNSLDEAIRGYQTDNGLKVDGILNPGGPTIASIIKLIGRGSSPRAMKLNIRDGGGMADVRSPAKSDIDPGFIIGRDDPDIDPGFRLPGAALPPRTEGGETLFSMPVSQHRSLLDIPSRSSDGGSGMVHVQSYEQNRDGQSVHVSDYERRRPGEQSGASHSAEGDALPTLEESFLIDEWRDERHSSPPPNLTPDQQRTWETLETLRNLGENRLGYEVSPALLDHYLDGSGEPWEVDADWARKYGPIQEGEARSQQHFEDWLTGTGTARKDKGFGTIDDWLASGKPTLDINGMNWKGGGTSSSANAASDQGLSLGSASVVGTGDLHLERHGNEVVITGTVEQHMKDDFDFQKGSSDSKTLGMAGWLPQGIPAGDLTLDRARIEDLEKAGGAKAFAITSPSWTKKLTGRLKLDGTGKVVGSEFHWQEVPR